MWIALVTLGIAAVEFTALRFGADSREPGDWNRIDQQEMTS